MGEQAALGLIETRGLAAAIVAADAAATAANVGVHGCEVTPGGIVTVMVTGSVGDVTAAVEAGQAAAARAGTVLTSHVVARPDDAVTVIARGGQAPARPAREEADGSPPLRVPEPVAPAEEDAGEHARGGRPGAGEPPVPGRGALMRMRVSELRRRARAAGVLTPAEITTGTKARLIDALMDAAEPTGPDRP